MRLLKRSQRASPRLSIVLLDWSVRESFHLLHYLEQQSVSRDEFEVIVIEYFARQSPALQPFLSMVDQWVLLDMPEACCYHKHLMYNAGIAMARGSIVLFCDSDAMVRESFVASVVSAFDQDPGIVLHLDQFRNVRTDLYPFRYPSFDEVLGQGCINNVGGRTSGVATFDDPLHERNYGACMAAMRDDLIAIGGADEHVDYAGHICGPYDMTFRLVNYGRREVWHASEFLYHTWHPGQAGVGNYLGPHDGRHMSTTALETLATHRVSPYVENPAIAALRVGEIVDAEMLEQRIIAADRAELWTMDRLTGPAAKQLAAETRTSFDYRGFRVEQKADLYLAHLIIEEGSGPDGYTVLLASDSADGISRKVDRAIRGIPRAASGAGSLYVLGWRGLSAIRLMGGRLVAKVTRAPRAVWRAFVFAMRRTSDRFRRFFMERSRLSGSLGSLVINLYHLRRRPELAGTGGRPVVITDTRAFAHYLRALSTLGVLPRLEVVEVAASEALAAIIATHENNGGQARLIVGRDFYMKHRGVFAASSAMRQIIVV